MPDGFRRFYLLTYLSLCFFDSIEWSSSLQAASNPASGCWSFPGMSTLEVGTNPVSPAMADFNGDNKSDLIVGNEGSSQLQRWNRTALLESRGFQRRRPG